MDFQTRITTWVDTQLQECQAASAKRRANYP